MGDAGAKKTTLIVGGTGKTGRRGSERLMKKGLPVRILTSGNGCSASVQPSEEPEAWWDGNQTKTATILKDDAGWDDALE